MTDNRSEVMKMKIDQAFISLIKNQIKKEGCDKTVKGVVTNMGDGVCSVDINGVNFKIKTNYIYEAGQTVSVVCSGNEMRIREDANVINVEKGGTGKKSFTSGSNLIGNGSSSIKEYTALEVSNDLGIIIPEDHIIEESTSGTWEIRQRASGRVEVMGKALNVENNTTTQWGSIYYATSAIQLPQILQNAAIKNIQITSASAILFFVL